MSTSAASNAELLSELHTLAAASGQPLSGVFELTSRCNLACRMCYINEPAGSMTIRKQELSSAEWISLAREAANNGMVFLLLTGGEVFLRPDFFEIYEPLTRLGLVLTLFSNGTLITDRIAARLAETPPSRMEVTLYGATAATYDAITGVRGSYMRSCAGITALVKNNVPLVLKTTLTRTNIDEVVAMRQMAANWGVPFYEGWLLSKRRDGKHSDLDSCRLSESTSIEFEIANDPPNMGGNQALRSLEVRMGDAGNFYCQAGRSSFVINPKGEMNVCIDLALPAALPLEIGFHAAWKKIQEFVATVPPVATTCRACDMREHCPRCPAWSWLETKTLSEPVPFLCNLAKMRKAKTGALNN